MVGENYIGSKKLNNSQLKQLKDEQRGNSIGYMIGQRCWNNEIERVIVFFQEKPKDIQKEEIKRRNNGFLRAKYYSLQK